VRSESSRSRTTGYSVAGTFADLLADGLEQGEHVLRATVFHHGAGIGNAVEGNFHGYLAAGTELLFDIVGKEHAGSSATGCFNGGFEFVLLHGCAGPAEAPKRCVQWNQSPITLCPAQYPN